MKTTKEERLEMLDLIKTYETGEDIEVHLGKPWDKFAKFAERCILDIEELENK